MYQSQREGNSLQSAEENTKRVKKPRASEVPEEELDDLPHMDFSDDEPNIETEGGVGLGEDAPANAEIGVGVGLGGEASNDEEEVDEVNVWNRWAETNPDSLDAEEGYYSNHSSVDGDDDPTQADIDKCDDEFRDLAKECDNIFVTEEAEVHHTTLPVHNPGLEMIFYTRVKPDGTTFRMRKSSNLIHTCPGRSGQSNKNANAQWVAKEVEETIRTVRTTRPAGVKELISRRHMYKNMKKFYKGTQIEWIVWSTTKAFKQSEKNEHMDQLKLEIPAAHDWLLKEPFEYWDRSHFDFTAKCEHITNNFRGSRQKSGKKQHTNHFLPPQLVRGAGRHRKQRIPNPNKEKRQKRCRKYGGYGHNKKICKGAPATPRPRVARAPKMVDTNVSMAIHMCSASLPPAIPNMRGRGSGGIGGGGSSGRSARGTKLTQDTKSPRPTQASQAPIQTRASIQQV
ncbi:hypothetical protein GIB67_033003 [Kingdonia uniflora]|uniref:Uncharacterized protein n=1 Tax=Kingdonia uniflora TaxID=39325 RepID=A0A7J7MY86_9MAGN|nr:hypothetical protein GIB67_033003 [Kingdonia uniflora]